jgi:hypothetical protein
MKMASIPMEAARVLMGGGEASAQTEAACLTMKVTSIPKVAASVLMEAASAQTEADCLP